MSAKELISEGVFAQVIEWSKLKANATKLAIEENSLRTSIYELVFPTEYSTEDIKGTFNKEMPDGGIIKLELGQNVKIDKALLKTSWRNLRDVKKIPMDEIITFNPTLKQAEYNKLTDVQKEALADIISFNAAKEKITLVAPKEKK